MKKHDIAELAVLILGIFFLVQILPVFLIRFFSGDILTAPLEFLPMAVLLLIGLVFVYGARRLSGLLVRSGEDEELKMATMSFTDWQALFISVIGVVTVVRGIGSLGSYAAAYGQLSPFRASGWLMILSPALELVFGFLLFIKARAIAEWWRSMQEKQSMRAAEG